MRRALPLLLLLRSAHPAPPRPALPAQESWREGDSLWLRVGAPPGVLRYIVPKGFVAVDGASLTVCEVDTAGSTFTLMLIAYTQSRLTLPAKAAAAAAAGAGAPPRVNLEADVTGKLVERFAAGLVDAVARVEATNARLEARLSALEARVPPAAVPPSPAH